MFTGGRTRLPGIAICGLGCAVMAAVLGLWLGGVPVPGAGVTTVSVAGQAVAVPTSHAPSQVPPIAIPPGVAMAAAALVALLASTGTRVVVIQPRSSRPGGRAPPDSLLFR
ncbi:MAG: hypothetical protein GXX79_05695 [Actinomycetales bacterium]|nr:hypothetical protein [Actinomycetales bacterium]